MKADERRERVEQEVKALILMHASSTWRAEDMDDNLSFFGDGLGFDSVELVELLFACEDRFGIHCPAQLITDSPLTVGRLIGHVLKNLRG